MKQNKFIFFGHLLVVLSMCLIFYGILGSFLSANIISPPRQSELAKWQNKQVNPHIISPAPHEKTFYGTAYKKRENLAGVFSIAGISLIAGITLVFANKEEIKKIPAQKRRRKRKRK